MEDLHADLTADRTEADATKPSVWHEEFPNGAFAGQVKAEINEGIYHALADGDGEVNKPEKMAPLAGRVVDKLKRLYPRWQAFPEAGLRHSHAVFAHIIAELHNKFTGLAVLQRTVRRMRQVRHLTIADLQALCMRAPEPL